METPSATRVATRYTVASIKSHFEWLFEMTPVEKPWPRRGRSMQRFVKDFHNKILDPAQEAIPGEPGDTGYWGAFEDRFPAIYELNRELFPSILHSKKKRERIVARDRFLKLIPQVERELKDARTNQDEPGLMVYVFLLRVDTGQDQPIPFYWITTDSDSRKVRKAFIRSFEKRQGYAPYNVNPQNPKWSVMGPPSAFKFKQGSINLAKRGGFFMGSGFWSPTYIDFGAVTKRTASNPRGNPRLAFSPMFYSSIAWQNYIRRTLIPDLRRSGNIETAKDFARLAKMVEQDKRDNSFERYLERTLIPDLMDSGYEATGEDFQEGIYWLRT